MNIKNLSEADRKNAINLSKRGRIFSLVMNTTIAAGTAVVMCLSIQQSPTGRIDNPYTAFFITLIFVVILVFFAINFWKNRQNILELSMFNIKPTEKELKEQAERVTKKLEKRLEEIEQLTNSHTREKQEIQAKLI